MYAFEASVIDVSQVFDQLGNEPVACLKLNIEGREYKVLERLLDMNQIIRCKSFLIQFHPQPAGREQRGKDIEARLQGACAGVVLSDGVDKMGHADELIPNQE